MPPSFKLSSFVLLVSDMETSKEFYCGLLGQEIAMDIGLNVGFKSGLALWQKDYALNVIHGGTVPYQKGNDVEVYFETEKIDAAWEKVRGWVCPVIHGIREQPWCQRVFRVADPDWFIVEIAEPMDAVVRRLHAAGHTETGIIERTTLPEDIVRAMLKKG
jgi:predicted enzyme related to lactoylglutathione lyase